MEASSYSTLQVLLGPLEIFTVYLNQNTEITAFKRDLSSVKILCCLYVHQPEHPRHPHITHSTIFP